VSVRNLFPEIPTIYFYPHHISGCDKLTVCKTREKKVVTLDIGAFKAKEIILQCPEDKALYRCHELNPLGLYSPPLAA
jgi:hypothetical protein